MVGTVINHYRILELLGTGGMGEVYAADDTKLKRRVALKILPRALASDPERRDRFEREAQAVASLNHPGIVTIYSVELSGDVPFLTMELVDGRPLAESIPRSGVVIEKLFPIAISLADAIAAAHQRGIVHRDLKPANVMLTDDGRVKVLDFGLAKLKEPPGSSGLSATVTQPVTEDGKILGTVAYMSPEQAEGKPVDARPTSSPLAYSCTRWPLASVRSVARRTFPRSHPSFGIHRRRSRTAMWRCRESSTGW